MISQEDYLTYADQFDKLIATVHGYATLIFILTFLGYGFAVFLWFQDYTWTALITATFSYLFFRQFRTLSLWLARRKLQSDNTFEQPMKLLNQALSKERPQTVFAQLDAYARTRRNDSTSANSDGGSDGGGNGGD